MILECGSLKYKIVSLFLLLKNVSDDKCARVSSPSKSKKSECPPPVEQVSTLLHLTLKALLCSLVFSAMQVII